MAKEKMSNEKKTKLIYSGELIFFALVFTVIAVLELTRVLHLRDWVLIAFNWITIFGGTWMIVDFFWVMFSKKRRPKNSLLDKALLVPLGIFLIVFDIICFTKQIQKVDISYDFRLYMMTSAFIYVAAIYLFQGIYHYFKPIPAIIEAIKEADEEDQKKLEEQQQKEQETSENSEQKEDN